ncbi:GNAT family N-acetyltransferase [Peribacillus faecalis]|nr:GNAT family N-acetyltransferase [Peribacillus faecalis]
MNYKAHISNNEEEASYIRKKLIEFNTNFIPKDDYERITITLKDEQGHIVGGLLAVIEWQSLHIDVLWVDNSLRGEGQGKKLVSIAEKIASEKGCTLIKLDTFSFQALEFYQKLGYEVFGELKDFPAGHTQYYLYKRVEPVL